MAKSKNTYTSGDVAELLGIPARTARRYLTTGKIPASQNPITGTWKINKTDLVKFMKKYNLDTSLLVQATKILIVDDDPAIITFVLRVLASTNWELETDSTTDGYEALIKIGKSTPHLAILDVQMPGTDGKQILKALKESVLTRDTKILVITGYPDYIEEMKELGADDGIAKPFKMQELLEKIGQLLPDIQEKISDK